MKLSNPSPHPYAVTVICVGVGVIIESLWRLYSDPPGVEWFLLALLTLLTGSFTVKVPSLPAKLSVSEPFVFTSALLFGPAAGTITVVLDALVISLWMKRSRRTLVRTLFNAAAPAIALRVGSEAFFLLTTVEPGNISRTDVGGLIIPIFLFALIYFLANTMLVAGALATERRQSTFEIWRKNFPTVSLSYFVGGSIGLLIVASTEDIDWAVLSIIIPLLLISYLTFRGSMGRLEDANRHVEQVNDLYLSTIEALALAVDAKDQITHGHIRRVQVYAVQLAERLGVSDKQHIKAIEVAALLHDMGKLAIPEHILNKPGKLSKAEFHKMKRHAAIGADLLSSVRFPYPVVPIVRHHHESWVGGGYPSGIAGTDIPLGARILSVVDCFDALTSDRPYRPRLSNEAAFDILRERSGTMYDPLVVDTFINVFAKIAPAAIKAGQEARSLVTAGTFEDLTSDPGESLRQIRASASETAVLGACDHAILASNSAAEALSAAGQSLRELTPATVLALYTYDTGKDALVCTSTLGDTLKLLDQLTISLGERVTGWCGANLTTVLNSDASLDLVGIGAFFVPPLRSAICTPLVKGDRLLGVLTGYSPKVEAFAEQHQYTFEHVTAVLSVAIERHRNSNVTPFRRLEA